MMQNYRRDHNQLFTAEYFIKQLNLEPHIEGGFFREIYQNSRLVSNMSNKSDPERFLSSTIYYLLRTGEVSKLHRLHSDEIWFYHYGSPMLIHIIDETGELNSIKLGLDVENGEVPQVLVPANQVFGAEIIDDNSFCLVSCMVSPGFDYRDFKLFSTEQLLELYPQHKELIISLNEPHNK